jgi:hypothetical protein
MRLNEKTRKKVCLFTVLFLMAGLFTACSNMVTEPAITGARTLAGRPFAQTLSEMTEEECLEFIIQNGVEIPDALVNPGLGAFVKSIIREAERNPDVPLGFSYTVTHHFAESIRAAVNGYYGTVQGNSAAVRSRFYLQDSWVLNNLGVWSNSSGGYWEDVWENYNCYSYAIGKTDSEHDPGDFAHPGSYNAISDMPVEDVAQLVKDDLEFLGYVNVYSTDTAPDPASFEPHQELICVRIGGYHDDYDDWYSYNDYHFMKYNREDGYWYHKPGDSAPLKYKYHPSYDTWTDERSFGGIEHEGDIEYDGDIWYIVYSIKTAKPTASPPGGIYAVEQNIILNCATSGATIYYTTDGSEPTTSSTLYTGPITVGTATTIKAIAYKSGIIDSNIMEEHYKFVPYLEFVSCLIYLLELGPSYAYAFPPVIIIVDADSAAYIYETFPIDDFVEAGWIEIAYTGYPAAFRICNVSRNKQFIERLKFRAKF